MHQKLEFTSSSSLVLDHDDSQRMSCKIYLDGNDARSVFFRCPVKHGIDIKISVQADSITAQEDGKVCIHLRGRA